PNAPAPPPPHRPPGPILPPPGVLPPPGPPGTPAAGITPHRRQPRTHRVSQVTLFAGLRASGYSQAVARRSRAIHEMRLVIRKVLRVHGPPSQNPGPEVSAC